VHQPTSFEEELSLDWSVWVLDHGLPGLPVDVRRGQSVPVARWPGPRFGAVLHLQWMWGNDDDGDDYLATEIELFRRVDGGWEPANGSGGSEWPFGSLLVRPALPPGTAQFWGEVSSGEHDWAVAAIDGLAAGDAAAVEVIDLDGLTRHPIDSPLGVVLAAVDATRPATVQVLDGEHRILATRDYSPWMP
jgi:hypothetical protein